MGCELCREEMVLFGDEHAFARYDNNSLSKGHVLVVPRRHVADFFEMTQAEKTSILALLDRAKAEISRQHSPDGYNIGVNIGKAAGVFRGSRRIMSAGIESKSSSAEPRPRPRSISSRSSGEFGM